MQLQKLLPAAGWLRNYERGHLRDDILAGLTTAVMLVPQGMAYALLAGLPPIVGLYASVVPLALYALFGTSRQLAVGPVAMVSLLVLAGIGSLNPSGVEEYVAYAVLLALMVGVIQLGMGLIRAGFLVNFLSHPVVSGFTSAAALIIGFSQLGHLMGVKLDRSHHVHTIVGQAWDAVSLTNVAALVIGVLGVVGLLALKKFAPRVPRALVAVVLATVAVFALGLNVTVVGEVPGGFPAPALPTITWAAVEGLLPTAITISLVSFMESISVAKKFASERGYRIDANQELIGLGLANVGGAFFGAYPVTGGFSRTAVNAQAGARTPLASLVTAGVVALALMFLTPLFYHVPKAVLAAIIMTAVFGLIDYKEVLHLWKVDRVDLALLALTFLGTLTLGIETGIIVGVVASLLAFVLRTTRPHYAVLGRLPGTRVWRNVKNFPEAETKPGVVALRIDASFYYGNVNFLRETLRCLEDGQEIRKVVIDASSVNRVDSSADTALHEIARDYHARGIELVFAGVKGPVREVMRRSGLRDLPGVRFEHEVADAMAATLPMTPRLAA